MRRLGFVSMILALAWPTTAWAEATALPLTSLRAAQPTGETPQPTSSRAPESTTPPTTAPATGATVTVAPQPTSSRAPESTMQPTSSRAPESTTPLPEPTQEGEPEDDLEAIDGEGEGDDVTLEEGREAAAIDGAFHRHALGAHAGIVVIPTWLLSSWLATHTNALCRGSSIGGFALDHGLTQQEGCNFYAGADYAFRFSRVLDIGASVQYQRAKVPDGLWLDKNRFDGSAGSLEAADYTEVDLGLIAMEVDFIARAPVVVTKDVEFGIGGGGGLGLGVVLGGVYQTPLGAAPEGFSNGARTPNTCQTLEDLADLTRCTPRYDVNEDGDMMPPDESELSEPNPDLFASCTSTECNEADLDAFGYRRKQGGIPPVIPVVNLILSMRLIIKDTFGITVNGGWNTGFYFGGGMQVFFGKAEQDEMRRKPGAQIGQRRARRAAAAI